MRLFRVLASLLEAVGDRGQADLVAPHALVDARADDGGDEVESGSRHDLSSGMTVVERNRAARTAESGFRGPYDGCMGRALAIAQNLLVISR